MIVDGRKIAEGLKGELRDAIEKQAGAPSLAVFVLTSDFTTQKFIAIKQKVAKEVGVEVVLYDMSPDTDTQTLVAKIEEASKEHDGIIVQFPLPTYIDRDIVRNAIPSHSDIDVISDEAILAFKEGGRVLPPVVGAIREILKTYKLSLHGKKVTVVGEGRLVGRPSALWAGLEGAEVTVVNAQTDNIKSHTQEADVLILGAGVPGLIKPDMVKEGVLIFDAGTSEARGKLSGDADPACADIASLFTPVPGGIGPITIAILFKNLLALSE